MLPTSGSSYRWHLGDVEITCVALNRFVGGAAKRISVAAKETDKQIDTDRCDNATRRAYRNGRRIGDLQPL